MLSTIAIVLIAAWLLGLIILPGIGALIHILLIVAVVVVIVRLVRGDNI